MLKLYSSTSKANVVRDSSEKELENLQRAYNILINYEMIEQKYSVICNNNMELDIGVVEMIHKSLNDANGSMLMYVSCEVNRKLFNALSSYYAYHEFMDELYEQKIQDVSTFDFKNHFKSILNTNELLSFGWDLRHYYNHYGFPCTSISVKREHVNQITSANPLVTDATIASLLMKFDKSALNSKFTWKAQSLSLIGKQQSSFDVLPLVNKYFHLWCGIHAEIRRHYSQKLEWAKSLIRDLFVECKKDMHMGSFLCIADDANVHLFANTSDNSAYFENATSVHGQFIYRVNYYLDNFMAYPRSNGCYITLVPSK